MLSYLKYPIQRSFMYGVQSDSTMQRIARRSQAAFNIITVMEPQLHDWDLDYAHAQRNEGAMRMRKSFDPLFLGVFQNLGYFVSMDGSKALGEDNMITLGDAALKYEPIILHALMVNDGGLAAAPIFWSNAFGMHLASPEIREGVKITQAVTHHVKEPA